MANTIEGAPFNGPGQRAQTPAGETSRTNGVNLSSGKLSPVSTTKAENSAPVGKVDTGTSGKADLDAAVARIQDYVQDSQRSLDFRLDEETGITVVSVYDRQTHELIRQIPSEEAVNLAQKLNQEEPLSLFRAQV